MKLAEARSDPGSDALPLRMGLPALDAFPTKLWSSLAVRAARNLGAAVLDIPDPLGHRPLRQAVASYLGIARGVTCTPEQVLITAGFQGALSLVTQVLLRPGDPVWVEDPGYPLARQRLEASGARLVPVRVDDDGMRVAAATVAAPRARLALVTPPTKARSASPCRCSGGWRCSPGRQRPAPGSWRTTTTASSATPAIRYPP